MRDQQLKKLWAPWRLSYVASPKPAGEDEPCFICQGLASQDDRENLIVLRTTLGVVLLNRFPYNNGHLLVAPKAHKGRLGELGLDELAETMQLLQRMIGELDQLLRPEGYNIGLNLGRAGGAGVPGHLHWHIVPRWQGDTNFMPIIAGTKVIAQSLDSLYELLAGQVGRAR